MPGANAIPLTAGAVAAATGGSLSGPADRAFTGVSIDTRTVADGQLFFAIRGERFDGAEFAQEALGKGAAGVVVPRGWRGLAAPKLARDPASEGGVVIEVDDTTAALQALANTIRRQSGTKVVAITGSAGKTTTKEITSELLATRYRVIRNRGNLNNHIGLPLSLIDLRERPEIAVVELGMNHPGEIRTLVHVAEPEIRVWTNVGEAHLGFFPSMDAIADAKAEILEESNESTVLVANADDERIASRMAKFRGRVVGFGIERAADIRASAVVDRGIEGTRARLHTPAGDADVVVPLAGRANLANVLAATAVAVECAIPVETIAERIASLKPASHRGEIVHLTGDIVVIDDSYNANPTATKYAIRTLTASKTARAVAVLGEMLELGDQSIALHRDVGGAVAAAGVDVLISIGGEPARALADAAVAGGLRAAAVRHFDSSADASRAVVELVQPGDLVLVKGSRGIKTDRVVDALKAERG